MAAAAAAGAPDYAAMLDDASSSSSSSSDQISMGMLAAVVSVPVATMLLGSFFAYFAQPPERVRAIVSAIAGGLLIGSVGFEMAPLLVKENGGHPMRIKNWNGGVLVGLGVSLVVTALLTIVSNILEGDEDEDGGEGEGGDGEGGDGPHKGAINSASSDSGHSGEEGNGGGGGHYQRGHHQRGHRQHQGRNDTLVQVDDRSDSASESDALLKAPPARRTLSPPQSGRNAVVPGEPAAAQAQSRSGRRRRHAAATREAKLLARRRKQLLDSEGGSGGRYGHGYDYGYGSGATRMFDDSESCCSCGCGSWLTRCFSARRCGACGHSGLFHNYPLGPVVLVFIDGVSDGLLTGISANLTIKQGWIIAASLAVEMAFTGAALSSILLDRKANRTASIITLAVVPLSMYVGSLSGNAAISVLDQDSPTFAGMVAFATGQIFYLASVELIGDALTMARDQRWPSFMVLFDAAVLGGFIVGIAMQLLLPE